MNVSLQVWGVTLPNQAESAAPRYVIKIALELSEAQRLLQDLTRDYPWEVGSKAIELRDALQHQIDAAARSSEGKK